MAGGRKRYAQVGIGGRSVIYTDAIIGPHKDQCELVAFCDINQGRMDLRNRQIAGRHPKVKTYKASQFSRMVANAKPDVVIVTTGPDVTHSDIICKALELGCDVITEKPMTTDEVRCRKILNTAAKTGRKIQVTFNYRYSPPRSQIKELIMQGAIGEVLSVDFAWLLDTRHGADYFRRWHRMRKNSGSLLVHKATHHFDLVNWWLGDIPEEVFCHGTHRFYTPQMADEMGLQDRADRCLDCPAKAKCRFYMDMRGNEELKNLYLDNEKEDGYIRDRCLFGPEIDIWDNMSVSVRYKRGALLNYMLHTFSAYEGYSIAFNGTKGRIEHFAREKTYFSGDGSVPGELDRKDVGVKLMPLSAPAQSLEVQMGEGGHGGGDPVLLADIFDPNAPADPLKRKANQRDGAYSILVGVAAYHSIDKHKPIRIPDLLKDAPLGE